MDGENELALESGIKSDLFESFMSGMQNLFTEHMINVPEDKVEILEQQAEVIDELEDKFDELLSENVSLKQTLKGIAKQNKSWKRQKVSPMLKQNVSWISRKNCHMTTKRYLVRN